MEGRKKYIGLSDSEVIASRQKHGANILTPPKKEPLWKLFLKKFEDYTNKKDVRLNNCEWF